MSFETKSTNKVFGGVLTKYSFVSSSLGGLTTSINVFLPNPSATSPVPVLYYLSGLTCTEDNAAQKGGFFESAVRHNIAIVFPDTSPRGANLSGEQDSYDFGIGAGFYLNATKDPWKKYYNMYDYIVTELPLLLEKNLPNQIDLSRSSITGHSMGGHGALTIYLKNLQKYRSVSAFAPICNPTSCPWGQKAFKGYLESPQDQGPLYDATLLVSKLDPKQCFPKILIDSGTLDSFYLSKQLLPENLIQAFQSAGIDQSHIQINLQEGYDHSYFFVSTFAAKHVEFHATFLNQ